MRFLWHGRYLYEFYQIHNPNAVLLNVKSKGWVLHETLVPLVVGIAEELVPLR